MSLETLIQTHGYWVIFLGTLLEGETILVLGGVAAHHGYLGLPGVLTAAFAGSVLNDQLFFYLGRRHGPAVLARRPRWNTRVARAQAITERHGTLLILGCRFLYGLRTATPFVIGMTPGIGTGRFVALNLLGAAFWSGVVGGAGYAIGDAAERFLGHARHYEVAAFVAVAAVGLLVWGAHLVRAYRAGSREAA